MILSEEYADSGRGIRRPVAEKQHADRGTPMPTVLIVDDEKGYREYVKRALERTGVRVRLAATPDAALGVVREVQVDMMIVDIRLPGKINGLDLAEQVKKENRGIALMVITGYSSPEYERRSRALGAIEYL